VTASRPGRFTTVVRAPGTHWIGGWMGPRAGLEAVARGKNPLIPPGIYGIEIWSLFAWRQIPY